MSEYVWTPEPGDDRKSPEVLALVGDIAVTLTFWNTTVVQHRPHPFNDHIRVEGVPELPYGGRIFDRRELTFELIQKKFPYLARQYPTDDDVTATFLFYIDRDGLFDNNEEE